MLLALRSVNYSLCLQQCYHLRDQGTEHFLPGSSLVHPPSQRPLVVTAVLTLGTFAVLEMLAGVIQGI